MPPTHKARFLGEVYPRAAFTKARRKKISRCHTATNRQMGRWRGQWLNKTRKNNMGTRGGGAWMSPKVQKKKILSEKFNGSSVHFTPNLERTPRWQQHQGTAGGSFWSSPLSSCRPTCLLQTAKVLWHEPDHLFYQSLSSWFLADK